MVSLRSPQSTIHSTLAEIAPAKMTDPHKNPPSPVIEDEKVDGKSNHATSGPLVTHLGDAKVPSDGQSSDYERQGSTIKAERELEQRLANPLKGLSQDQVVQRGRDFAVRAGIPEKADLFAKGALLARDPLLYETLPLLDDQDRADLRREEQKRWDQPWTMYLLVICCSLGAVVQGEFQRVPQRTM